MPLLNMLLRHGSQEAIDDDEAKIRQVFTGAQHLQCSSTHATCFHMYDHNLYFQ